MLTVFLAEGITMPVAAPILEAALGVPSGIVFARESPTSPERVALAFIRTPEDLYKVWQRRDLIRRTMTDSPCRST